MKFVALVSGGKDSCYNICECLRLGHELTVMANLRPKEGRPEEIDSYMYQTVGYKSVDKLAKCAGVPLVHKSISEDESSVVTELAQLLLEIKHKFGVEGVSAGAIGSSYQQQRVDKACALAGMRSLTFMWQRDQCQLLEDIVASGVDARIIKVASLGLNSRHLGLPLKTAKDELISLHKKLGIHPCGEGGEFETFVVDAPFFKQRLEIVEPQVVQLSADDVYYLKFNVEMRPKTESESETGSENIVNGSDNSSATSQHQDVASAALDVHIDPEFRAVEASALDTTKTITKNNIPLNARLRPSPVAERLLLKSFIGSFDNVFSAFRTFIEGVDIDAVLHVYIAVQDMSTFAHLNQLYNNVLSPAASDSLPPSRTCIQADVGNDLELSVLYSNAQDPSTRGIHCQGLSFWAPASIGPYSQCRMSYGISYAAGQIGLIPQNLDMMDPLEDQASLALQHAHRILDLMHTSRDNWDLRLAIVYLASSDYLELVNNLWKYDVPLISVVVPKLPRNAKVEWSLQACDRKYFKYFVPDSDDDDDFYSENPEILELDNANMVYKHRAGFQTVKVAPQLSDPAFSFGKPNGGHFVPGEVYFGLTKTDQICVQFE